MIKRTAEVIAHAFQVASKIGVVAKISTERFVKNRYGYTSRGHGGEVNQSREQAEQKSNFISHREGEKGSHLIFLHGLLGAVSNWETTQPEIAKFCKTHALSLPILTAHRSQLKMKSLAAYTESYIRENNLGPVVLCGNSLGGHVAMRLYLAAPELVSCLILSGASGLYEHSVDALPVRPDRKFIRQHMTRVFKQREFMSEERVEEVYKIVEHKANVLNLIHTARSAKKDNLLLELPKIKVPTLLIWGRDDEVTTMDVAQTFHENIPNSKLVVFEECGHAPMIEYPQRFAEEVRSFLKSNSQL
jgi:pimeloyl-ACP methyl ester carboxylesterase